MVPNSEVLSDWFGRKETVDEISPVAKLGSRLSKYLVVQVVHNIDSFKTPEATLSLSSGVLS